MNLDMHFYLNIFKMITLSCVIIIFSSQSLQDYATYSKRLLRPLDMCFYENMFVIVNIIMAHTIFYHTNIARLHNLL